MDRAHLEFFELPRMVRGIARSQAERRLGENASNLIRSWLRSEHLIETLAICEPPTPLLLPLFRWCAMSPLPDDLEQWAHFAQTRDRRSAREISVLRFGRRVLRNQGLPEPNTSKPFQLGHDLMVTEIVLANHGGTDGWIGEDFFRVRHKGRLGGFVPDLAVLSPSGKIRKVIDYAGSSYGVAELLRMFEAVNKEQSRRRTGDEVIELEVW